MPSFDVYKKILEMQSGSIGQVVKSHSDFVMEQTWDRDIATKDCYLYDYYHDDSPELNKNIKHSKKTTKTKIRAKFLVTQYNTLAKDQVEFHILFKPSEKIRFDKNDELYYYETDFVQKYGAEFPIGLYMDIPDEKGIYRKWLVCSASYGNQFIKYSVLPCNYYLQWIEYSNHKKYKRQMWVVVRNQNSYNSGVWTDFLMTSQENQYKIWLPMNSITEKIFYVNEDNPTNQRFIVSAPSYKPLTWFVSKVENISPFGLMKITLAQDKYNPETDYINLETKEMYADYYMTKTDVIEDEKNTTSASKLKLHCNIETTSEIIKCGGSYKLLTFKIYDNKNNDVTYTYADLITQESWTCSIDGEDYTNNDLITWKPQPNKNQIRIKVGNDVSLYTKILKIECSVNIDENNNISCYLDLEIRFV